MSKILIGKRNGVQGAWIAAPGYNAEDAGGKMILDSQRDMMKLHHTETYTVSGVANPGSYEGWFYSVSLAFPALSYRPIVFWYTRWNFGSSDTNMYFPHSSWQPKQQAFGDDEEVWTVKVFNDHIELVSQLPFPGASSIDFTLFVYANEMP